MEAQEKIKKERILKISKAYKDYFILTNKNEYRIPIDVIENFYKIKDKTLIFVNLQDKKLNMFKMKR